MEEGTKGLRSGNCWGSKSGSGETGSSFCFALDFFFFFFGGGRSVVLCAFSDRIGVSGFVTNSLEHTADMYVIETSGFGANALKTRPTLLL